MTGSVIRTQPTCLEDYIVSNTIKIRLRLLIIIEIAVLGGWDLPSIHKVFRESLRAFHAGSFFSRSKASNAGLVQALARAYSMKHMAHLPFLK